MEDDGFTLVRISSKRSRRRVFRAIITDRERKSVVARASPKLSPQQLAAEAGRIERNFAALRGDFSDEHIRIMCRLLRRALGGRQLSAIRILGIGKFSSSLAAALQLIFVEAVREYFGVIDVASQEPILSEAEIYFLRHRNIRTPPVSDRSALRVGSPENGVTLFYMIHSEHFMYDDVLRTNWCTDALRNLIIVGNDFRNYSSASNMADGLPALRAFATVCRQVQMSIPLKSYAFSDTCVVYLDEDANSPCDVLRQNAQF